MHNGGMTNIQLPDVLLDLFAAFSITDPAQALILLLSGILALLLLLIIIIAVRGRSAPVQTAVPADPSAAPSAGLADQRTEVAAPDLPAAEAEPELVEDFRIFKRPKGAPAKSPRVSTDTGPAEQLSTAEHLRLIEKNMIRLRDLYQGGHITRDMYVDETRSLYHQARGLSSVS